MHLTYNEQIRIRTERFVTNVLIENVPQVIIQIIYLCSAVYDPTASPWVVYLTLASSVSSVLFSGTYYFATCARDVPDKPVYSFHIVVRSEHFVDKPYLVHAHWNFSTAIQKAFGHRDPNYIVIDDVSKLGEEITIKGRVLEDIIYEDEEHRKMSEIAKKTWLGMGKNKNSDKLKAALSEVLEIEELVIKTLEVKNIKSEQDQSLFGRASVLGTPSVLKEKFSFEVGSEWVDEKGRMRSRLRIFTEETDQTD